MTSRGLKTIRREQTAAQGFGWRLLDADGREIESFSRFSEFCQRYSQRTAKRYLEVVGRFLDYLYAASVFEHPAPSAAILNAVIEAFPIFLRDGSEVVISRFSRASAAGASMQWQVKAARLLEWAPQKASSLPNTLAAVNHFLRLCRLIGLEELDRARVLGIAHCESPDQLLRVLATPEHVPSYQLHKMRQNSMLGSVAKFAGEISRPPGLRSGAGRSQAEARDFPLAEIPALMQAATNWRDRALWLLMAAAGLRGSEARNILLDDVDFESERVYVLDPTGRRFAPHPTVRDQPRFKGRAIAATYLFPPLRQLFFDALERYLAHEFVPNYRQGEPRYLFQFIDSDRAGEPYVNASDAAVVKSFKSAVARAGIRAKSGFEYTPHSLRHLYGVHMLNDYPVDPARGKYGLTLTDVQMLMGHKNLSSTQKYARVKAERLMLRLRASDEQMLGVGLEHKFLPPEISARVWTPG